MSVYANFDPKEGTNNGENIVKFKWRARKIVITNDSSTVDLKYKFNATESYGTLKPTETISMYHHAKEVYLNSASDVAYRIWGYG